jgi:hypothetical protein
MFTFKLYDDSTNTLVAEFTADDERDGYATADKLAWQLHATSMTVSES